MPRLCEGSHTGRAQGIVGALQHDAAYGGDGELQPHRHADAQKDAGDGPGETPLGGCGAQDVEAAHHVDVAQHGGQSLREDRGNGRAGHAPPQREDGEKVEHDVEHGREQQEPERRLAVAQRPDDAGQEVIEERTGNPDEGDEQVDIRLVEDIVRRTHQVQDVVAPDTRDYRQEQRHRRGQLQADHHATAHRGIVPRPELLRHRDAEASAAAVAEAQYQEHDRRTGPHGSQRVNAQKPPHDGGIHQRIRLLQQVAHQQGQSEIEKLREYPPRGHLLYGSHKCYPPSLHESKCAAKVRKKREKK